MAGSPTRRSRKLSAMAVQRSIEKGIPIEQAVAQIEAEEKTRIDTSRPAKPSIFAHQPPGEIERQKLDAARELVRSTTGEWLIGTAHEICEAYETRGTHRSKCTPETVERILYLIRAGTPLKDTLVGPGAATMCGITPATVWDWVHTNPAFADAYRTARDASSEVLEDEMRAMLPLAISRPELLDAFQFVAARLEWLARVRNKDRYGNAKDAGAQGGNITFNIGTLPAQGGENRPAATVKIVDKAPLPGGPITIDVTPTVEAGK